MPRIGAALGLLLSVALLHAQPDEEARAQARLAEVRAAMTEVGAERQRLQGALAEQVEALRSQDLRVAESARELRLLDEAVAARESELSALEAERAAMEVRMAGQRQALAKLLRSTYVLGQDAPLRLLFSQDRVDSVGRALAYHRYLKDEQLRRLRALGEELADLLDITLRVAAERDAVATARAARAQETERLAADRAEQQRRRASLESELRSSDQRLAALGRDERELLALLERLSDIFADIPATAEGAEPFANRRGRLPWPVRGRVLAAFGAESREGRASTGMLIDAEAGAEVRAVGHGRVVFADWLAGFGLLLIVDHGDSFLSLYGQNETLLRDSGEWVAPGDAVATVGQSGGRDRPALYFELRQAGRAIDPRPWLMR
ncbi:MAG TPA: peptidoglycan DD-metalloendopeptidase family protein [Xanthomonadaceae bacterium]|nr:peptidoglycan DD-metalloendopeptidase family protein [Xanthomonadaceae bacterium]